jgi:trafficking protein particle complex subunit 11
MEAYPAHYTAHNLPLVVLSGLGSESSHDSLSPEEQDFTRDGIIISSESPLLEEETEARLLQEFRKFDGTDKPWNGRIDKARGELIGFKVKAVGRVGQAHMIPPLLAYSS